MHPASLSWLLPIYRRHRRRRRLSTFLPRYHTSSKLTRHERARSARQIHNRGLEFVRLTHAPDGCEAFPCCSKRRTLSAFISKDGPGEICLHVSCSYNCASIRKNHCIFSGNNPLFPQYMTHNLAHAEPLQTLRISSTSDQMHPRLTRRQTIDTDPVWRPLRRQRLREHNDSGLGCVVGALSLWAVDNGARHRGNENDATARRLSDHVTE